MLLADKKILVMMVLVMLYAYAIRQEQQNCDSTLRSKRDMPICKIEAPSTMPKSPNFAVSDQVVRPNQSLPDSHKKAVLPIQDTNTIEKTAIQISGITKATTPSEQDTNTIKKTAIQISGITKATTPSEKKMKPTPDTHPLALNNNTRIGNPTQTKQNKIIQPLLPQASPPQQSPIPEQFIKYIVKKNDKLWNIAREAYGTKEQWIYNIVESIIRHNPRLQRNPNKLAVDMERYCCRQWFIYLINKKGNPKKKNRSIKKLAHSAAKP